MIRILFLKVNKWDCLRFEHRSIHIIIYVIVNRAMFVETDDMKLYSSNKIHVSLFFKTNK